MVVWLTSSLISRRHEERIHEEFFHGEEMTTTNANPTEQDYKYNYHSAKLTFGLIILEFNDAIKEGDGNRLFDICLLYTSPSPRDLSTSRMPSSA